MIPDGALDAGVHLFPKPFSAANAKVSTMFGAAQSRDCYHETVIPGDFPRALALRQ